MIWQTENEFLVERKGDPEKFYRFRRFGSGPQLMRAGKLDHHLLADYSKKVKKQIKEARKEDREVPANILDQRPEYRKAATDYERYRKGWHTSFANRSIAVVDMRESTGYKAKRQDGKRLTSDLLNELDDMVTDFERAGLPIRDAMRASDLTICHTGGKHPFLSTAGGTYQIRERSISVGVAINGYKMRSLAHEVGHWLDYEASPVEDDRRVVAHTARSAKRIMTRCQSELDPHTTEFIDRALGSMKIRNERRDWLSFEGWRKKATTLEEKMTEAQVSKYWRCPAEVWARLVEQWVSTNVGRKSSAAEAPSYYENHACYWNKEVFAEFAPEIEARLWWLSQRLLTTKPLERAAANSSGGV